MYMGATRTQIYLTDEQRARLDERARREGVTLAQLIRRAVDEMLEAEDDLDATFGAAPEIAAAVPSRDEWAHRIG
jgi:predicted DNA-binding protein